MGCSLPMAIGVKLARPKERVWSISGDGGFQMNMQELGTIMEHGIDVKILLFNNGYLGMVRQWQTLFFDGRYSGTPMHNPDYGHIAQAYGIDIGVSGYLSVVVTATLASIGTAGVPGVGLVMLAMVLRQVNLPVEAIGLIIGIDRVLDMARTAVNITGDAAVSCIVARFEGQLDLDVYADPEAGA